MGVKYEAGEVVSSFTASTCEDIDAKPFRQSLPSRAFTREEVGKMNVSFLSVFGS